MPGARQSPLRQKVPFVFGRGDVQPRSIHLQDTIADLLQQGHKMWRRMLPVTIGLRRPQVLSAARGSPSYIAKSSGCFAESFGFPAKSSISGSFFAGQMQRALDIFPAPILKAEKIS